jgi:hypothetical protein
MKTLNIDISEIEYNKFGLKSENLNFADFVELISRQIVRQNLNKCVELSEKYGLSSMTIDEISEEINEVRRNAKNSN